MIDEIVNKIKAEIEIVFDEVDTWFKINENLLNYAPKKGGWSINKILEHISITNHFLLILIKKVTVKAIEKAKTEDYTHLLINYDLDWNKLNQIGEYQSFYWNRPEHMEPAGIANLKDIKDKLRQQASECIGYLDQLKKGEGVLCKTTMSVNELGKIDVYHYILFLAKHAKRHLTQIENIKKEFEQLKIGK
jgi:hypothetical protein